MLEKALKQELKRRVDDIKSGNEKYISSKDVFSKLHEKYQQKLISTKPIDRIIESLRWTTKNINEEINVLKRLHKIITTSKTIQIKEFLTGELIHCASYNGKKCNCLYGNEGRHSTGRTTFADIGIYDTTVKDFWWAFVLTTENENEKIKKHDEKFETMHISDDPLVSEITNSMVYPKDITQITIQQNDFDYQDVVTSIKDFMKKYFNVDKKVIWKW